ncbi:S1/P1 nuclease [Hansschlegelia plantiphila]|uniref:Endonuclease n=1 Tax=Hansschlegelia plantiphila TaxID=374655 RepID=A0A9W6IYX3_9HYPH|nr:S1/P1 nuclease [Hansschlegelia plantiphila]GLK66379.1 endonuclease [Hansschlegelia plantiphila]
MTSTNALVAPSGIIGMARAVKRSLSNGRRLSALLVIGLGSVLWAPACLAWGGEGHRVVAIIAQQRLEPRALAVVEDLLKVEGETDLAEIANWADMVKRTEPMAPVHSTRLPLDHSALDFGKVCGKVRACATRGITEQAAILSDSSRSPEERLKALKFVVHLVGDVHQPLHASADTGREQVRIGKRITIIHKVWDTLIIRFTGLSPAALAQKLVERPEYRTLQYGGSPADWTVESRDIARDVIFPDLARSPEVNGARQLPKGYTVDMRPIVFNRLTQAGVRLADLLNAKLKDSQQK